MAAGAAGGVTSGTTAGAARSARIASAITRLRERSNSLAPRSVAASRSLGSVMAMRANGIPTYPVLPGMGASCEWGGKLARAVVPTLKNGPRKTALYGPRIRRRLMTVTAVMVVVRCVIVMGRHRDLSDQVRGRLGPPHWQSRHPWVAQVPQLCAS